ncbi:uncharacterized protein C8orf48 homolog isoform X2 [Narcine bancroftii]|uniref:uncharacterized protein C8orf48 homolog isoform X2 n=1 Tax=Narcine bancroftii TaxID=1343680 RepID=UPI003832320D
MSGGETPVEISEDDSCEAGSSCRSVVKYSDESFAIYTDESEENHQSYSQSFESYQSFVEDFEPDTKSELSAIKSKLEFISPRNFKRDEKISCFEDSESLLAREKLIKRLLWVLKSNKFVSTAYHQKEKHTMFYREAIQPLQGRSTPVPKYYSMKIDQIRRQLRWKQSDHDKCGREQLEKPLEREVAPQQNCIVPQHLINQVNQTKIHQPSRCAACSKKISELAEHNFLRMKTIQLEEASMQEKIDEHIYTKDGLTLIGEIHNSLPKYSDTASLMWKTLFDKINLR